MTTGRSTFTLLTLSSLIIAFWGVSATAQAGDTIGTLVGDVSRYWTEYEPVDPSAPVPLPAAEEETDPLVIPVQMLAPQRALGLQIAQQRRRPNNNDSSDSSLNSVPFMIGDTGAGSCLSFGSFLDVDLGHPTLACSRLNISEGNTPLPTDRLYYSYRHFENSTPTRVFQYTEDFNVDRHTLAGERTFFDKTMSVEIRLPLEYRLNSQIGTYVVNPTDQALPFAPGFDTIFGFGSDQRVEVGNIAMIFKTLLYERENFALSLGLGVTLPTAKDVSYDATFDDFVTFTEAPFLARYAFQMSTLASNETFYLAPFAAWIYQPNERFFHQGFLQVETPANDSFVTVAGFGQATFDTNNNGMASVNAPEAGDTYKQFISSVPGSSLPISITTLQPQTLLRLNLGWGYVFSENQNADWIQKLTGLFELHYTTTLNDATINYAPLTVVTFPAFTLDGFDSVSVGNRNNRVDLLNAVVGVSANVGNWVVTNGCTAPIRDGSDRGFDFEYNLQLQRPF